MKLLVFTNVFDENSDLMGVVPSWVRALRRAGTHVTVLTQSVGVGDADRIISIDKKSNPSKLRRLFSAYNILWRERRNYDAVLVIMAPSWALLLSPLVRIIGRRIYLWYAVWRGNWKLRLAQGLVDGVICSVPESYPFQSTKVHAVGQGIDVDGFRPSAVVRNSPHVLILGRISPVKHIEVALNAVGKLIASFPALAVDIVGGVIDDHDDAYLAKMKQLVASLGISGHVTWHSRVAHSETVRWYQAADVVVNMTAPGSFDKTMLEAMACGAIVVSSNQALGRFLSKELQGALLFQYGNAEDLARALRDIWSASDQRRSNMRNDLRDSVVKNHALDDWARSVLKVIYHD